MKNETIEALRRFRAHMCDIEYVKKHTRYKLVWGIVLFFKELIVWLLLDLLAGYINSEITAAFRLERYIR